MLSTKGDYNLTEDHIDRGRKECWCNEDKNRLDAVCRYRLFVIVRYDSCCVADSFNCEAHVSNIHQWMWAGGNIQTPPIVNEIKYQALVLCRRHRWRHVATIAAGNEGVYRYSLKSSFQSRSSSIRGESSIFVSGVDWTWCRGWWKGVFQRRKRWDLFRTKNYNFIETSTKVGRSF